MTRLAFELRTSTPDPVLASIAARVEASGYRSLWVNHPPGDDGLGQLAKMAAATSRITLGTAVVPVSAVPPETILRRLAETGLPADRLRLGIGSGSGPRPLRRMANAVGYLRPRTPAEIVVGALGPRMRQLAATQADGVLLNNVTPAFARAAAEEIRTEAETGPARARRVRQRDGRRGCRSARRACGIRRVSRPVARLRRALPPDGDRTGTDLDRGRPAERASPAPAPVARTPSTRSCSCP